MPRFRVALATSAGWPAGSPDDAPLPAALRRAGLEPAHAVWSDPEVDWAAFDAVVIRSCWDYQRRLPEFRRWCARLTRKGVRLHNPAAIVRWNAHKGYLAQLAAARVATPATAVLRRGGHASLRGLERRLRANALVIKPAVGASAAGTWRTGETPPRTAARRLAREQQKRDLLVQAYVPEVAAAGEWSLVYFDGRFSHAALKRPGPGEFRVQTGTAVGAEPTRALRRAARQALAAAAGLQPGPHPLYARVDLVAARVPLLMELELIEPELFLRFDGAAAHRLARALRRRL